MRRATVEDAERIGEWTLRDFEERSDFTPFLSNPLNVFLIEGEGGAGFLCRGDGLFEVHVCFEQRGKDVIDLSHRMLAWMRENMGASAFMAAVPVDQEHRNVRLFTRLMGWESLGFDDLPHGRCEIFQGD